MKVNQSYEDKFKLDLHGVRHAEVSRLVDSFLGEMLTADTTHLYIVTGFSSEMQQIVKDTLDDYNLDYEIGDYFNPGYIKVSLL